MLLHPGVLALILGSAISCLLLFYAVALGVRITRLWDYSSSSEEQLILERKTHLVSMLTNMVLGFSIASGLLFLYTIEDIHGLFVGAMCATGTLNANPTGWWILVTKLLIFFSASLWVIFNNLDGRCEDAPLVKLKYSVLPFLFLLIGADFVLQILYFTGLEPQKITSCCGSLFSAGEGSVASEVAALPPQQTMWLFFSASCLYLVTIAMCMRYTSKLFRLLLFFEAVALLPISLIAIISFLSIYIYQLPTHHCPFDMLQSNYYFIGYPLYIGAFGGILFGMAPGLSRVLPASKSVVRETRKKERQWLVSACLFYLAFLIISTSYLVFSEVSFLV